MWPRSTGPASAGTGTRNAGPQTGNHSDHRREGRGAAHGDRRCPEDLRRQAVGATGELCP